MASTRFRISGPNLAETRIRKGLTQAQLAEAAGVWRSYIHRLESGDRGNPSPPVLKAITDALGCDLEAITERVTA